MMKKLIFLFLILHTLYADDHFFALSYHGTSSSMESSYNINNIEYKSNSKPEALSLAIGKKYNVYMFNTPLILEPSVGVTDYRNYPAELGIVFIELPMLYKYKLLGENFTFGPSLKIHYIDRVYRLDNDSELIKDTTSFNSSVGLKIKHEFDSFEYFLFSEYMMRDVYYQGSNVSGKVGMKNTYLGFGVILKYDAYKHLYHFVD